MEVHIWQGLRTVTRKWDDVWRRLEPTRSWLMRNWLKNPVFHHAISKRLRIMEMCQALKSSDSSYEPYIFPPIRFFIQLPRQTTLTTSGCWFICHNVRRNRLQQFSLLWKPIFGHIKILQSKSTPSPISFLKQRRLSLAAWLPPFSAKLWLVFLCRTLLFKEAEYVIICHFFSM